MGLLDDLGAGINKLGSEIEGAVNTGGKQMDLSSVRTKIRDAHAELGAAAYALRAQGTALDPSLEPIAGKVDALEREAQQLQAEIDAAKAPAAPSEGAAPAGDAAPSAAPAANACAQCGAANAEGAKFCSGCGAAMG
jgi:hypothetical protein